jgi:isopenicillin N synthase-like dioxygenase
VPLYALALDLPSDFFDECFVEPHMILRMSRYPVIDGEDETLTSLVPHTDSGFMTLLPPNPVPGLSIVLPSGRWIDAPGIDAASGVSGGDIPHRWTNERFPSAPHRVRNFSGQSRHGHRMSAELPLGRHPAEIPADRARPSCALARPEEL